MRANHVRNHTNIINGVKKEPNLEYLPLHKKGKNIPFTPELINNKTIDLFNKLYFDKQIDKNKLKYIHYDKYFFPLDGVGNWNKLYGKNGFIQYQFVLPFQKSTLEMIFTKKMTSLGTNANNYEDNSKEYYVLYYNRYKEQHATFMNMIRKNFKEENFYNKQSG
jgi:hypothetical protein